MKLVETVEYKDCYLDIYKSSSWFEKVYTGMSDSINFYSRSTDKTLVTIRFKEAVDKRLEDNQIKVSVEDLAKKVSELEEEVAHLKKRLGQKEATVIIELNEEEPFDEEAYDYYTNNEIPVTCEEDMWHNLEVRHRKLQRQMKANNSIK